mgnify:CR=1 FL=1
MTETIYITDALPRSRPCQGDSFDEDGKEERGEDRQRQDREDIGDSAHRTSKGARKVVTKPGRVK